MAVNLTVEEQEALDKTQRILSNLEDMLLQRRKKRLDKIDSSNLNVNLGLCAAAQAVLEKIG